MAVATMPLKPGQEELVRGMIERLRAGDVGSFIYPWRTAGISRAPRNGISGRRYSGYNRFATSFVGYLRNFKTRFG